MEIVLTGAITKSIPWRIVIWLVLWMAETEEAFSKGSERLPIQDDEPFTAQPWYLFEAAGSYHLNRGNTSWLDDSDVSTDTAAELYSHFLEPVTYDLESKSYCFWPALPYKAYGVSMPLARTDVRKIQSAEASLRIWICLRNVSSSEVSLYRLDCVIMHD